MFVITIMRKTYHLNIINGIGWLLFNTIFSKNIYLYLFIQNSFCYYNWWKLKISIADLSPLYEDSLGHSCKSSFQLRWFDTL